MGAALEGLRIVDCSRAAAGTRLTQLLADHGADVAWIEPPGGAPLRRTSPIEHAVFGRTKRSVVADISTADGVALVHRLALSADVFVEDWGPGVADQIGLGRDALHAIAPGLVMCSISGFGTDGPHRDVPGHEALVHALVGSMAEQVGMRPAPIFEALPFASLGAAYLAATGVLAALHRRHLDGHGRHVETSLFDGALAYLMMLWGDSDAGPPPHLAGGNRIVARTFECQGGDYIGLHTGAVGAFGRLMQVLGLDDRIPVSADGREMGMPLTPEQQVIVNDEIPEIMRRRPRAEWLRLLREADVCAVELLPPGEVFDQPQPRHNRMVVTIDDPVLGRLDQVATPAKFTVTPEVAPRPAPRVGDGHDDVVATWTDERAAVGGTPDPGPVLAGVHVVDAGAYYAGPYTSRLLGDLGADVIKLEPTAGDPLRGLLLVFRSASANKRSLAVNLKDPELEPARRQLIEWADVIQHNMRPGAAERLGLGYEQARALKGDIVYLYAPGWGSTGPDRDRQSFAPKMSGYVGADFEVAGRYNPPLFPLGNEDPGNGLVGAVATLIALVHRQRTGTGQFVENPQLNATMAHLAHVVRRADGEVLGAMRLDPMQYGFSALERLYPTADGWICLVAGTADEIAAVHAAFPATAQIDDDDELADVLAAAIEQEPTAHWLSVLAAAGVPAVEPLAERNSVTFLRDPEHRRTGRAVETAHPAHGNVREIDQLIRISDAAVVRHRIAPELGAHNDEILASLGYDEATIASLRERGAIR